ncbi:MAG TPA: septum site-determining protein Ssd [Frankiaceae bacterium]|nr:septum site-determining protein Ssd [Frankiaceae bacterium]
MTSQPDSPRLMPAARPLVVTSEPALLEELLRLCDAAGTPPLVAADPEALRRAWRGASLVLLGAELAGAAIALPRRSRVVVVGSSGERLWELAADVGADHVAVLPSAAGWLAGLLGEQSGPPGANGPVVCVIGGQGGAGATTLAAALARTSAARGVPSLLIDADPFGGGIDLALGLESAAGDRWAQVLGETAAGRWRDGFLDRIPARAGLHLLTPDRDRPTALTAEALRRVVDEGRRRCGLVVIDLPRSVDAVSSAALSAARQVFLVVPAQVRAVAAASQLAGALRLVTTDVQAVVRGPAPSGLSMHAIARSLALPIAGTLRVEPGLARDYERGVPPGQPRGPLVRLCAQLLDQLSLQERGAAA